MSISGRTFNNLLLIIITESLVFFSNFIIIYILTHLYNPSEFASYSFSFTFISFFLIISNLGLGSTLIRYLSSQKDQEKENLQKLITEGFKLILMFSTITSFILFLISKFINNIYNLPDLGIILSYASIYLLFTNLIAYFESTYKGLWLFKYYALSKIIFNLVKLTVILLNCIFNLAISTIMALYALISFIHFLTFLIIQIRFKYIDNFFSFDLKFISKILKFSLFVFIPELLLFTIINFNQFILAYYLSPSDFAVYSITIIIIMMVSLPIIFFSNLVFPYVSYFVPKEEENGKNVENLFNLTFYYGLLIMIPTTMFFFFFSEIFVVVVFGMDYINAALFLKLFIFYLNFKMIDILGGHILWADNKPKLVSKLYALSAFFSIILSLSLIPYLLTYGAILAIIIPHIMYIIITINIVQRTYKIHIWLEIKISVVKIIGSSIISAIITQVLLINLNGYINSIKNLIIISLFYFIFVIVILLITKAIRFSQIKDIVKIIRSSLN